MGLSDCAYEMMTDARNFDTDLEHFDDISLGNDPKIHGARIGLVANFDRSE